MALVDSSPNHPNKGPGLIIGFSFLAAFTTVIFGARIWSRRLTRQYFELDDHLCLASLVIQHGVFATAVVMVAKGGLGKDMSDAMAGDPNVLVVLPKVPRDPRPRLANRLSVKLLI